MLILQNLEELLATYPQFGLWYTAICRWCMPILAICILAGAINSLLNVKNPAEVWAYLALPTNVDIPLTHWENVIGRAPSCDVVIPYPTISRTHSVLTRRDDGSWWLSDLQSTGGTTINGAPISGTAQVAFGDSIGLSDVGEIRLLAVSATEQKNTIASRRKESRPASPWRPFLLLSVFQFLTCLQLMLTAGDTLTPMLPLAFLILAATMWTYVLTLRALRRIGFEMETIAFFLCTLNLAVVASSVPEALGKQLVAILLGLGLFLGLGWFLRDLERAKNVRPLMAVLVVVLLGLNLLLGQTLNGAQNWVSLGGISFQPSELVKIAFIFAGSATLDQLMTRRNLFGFIALSGFCLGALALMSDFGAAAIFFVTFLVIAFLRSGDFATLALICGGCLFAGMIVLRFKPYIANRFAVWGHVWSYASTTGYQQTRTMSAAASGGLVGVGAGNGWLHQIGAANTDLVFGMLCEEWGLIIAILAILSIVTLGIFAVKLSASGRSSFYVIAACAATSLLIFQTILNVFGAVDLLPLTGVTFPFVSNGGSAMLASWGLLAFLKAADTRQNASFAIPLPSRAELRGDSDEKD